MLTGVGVVGPAWGISCASHPDGSPRAIAAGDERLAAEGSFRDQYDGAILGTVLAVDTNEDGDSPQYGRSQVTVAVTASLGGEVTNPATIMQPDPGWNAGYGFAVGRHYFIPFERDAVGLHSFVCDPISTVDAQQVDELVEIATRSGWAVGADYEPVASASDVHAKATRSAGNDGADESRELPDARWSWGVLVGVVLVVVGMWFAFRRQQAERVADVPGDEQP